MRRFCVCTSHGTVHAFVRASADPSHVFVFLSGRDGVYFCRRCDRDSVCLVWRTASQHSRKHRAYAGVGSHHLQLMQVREKKLVSDFQTFSIIIFSSTINVRIARFF